MMENSTILAICISTSRLRGVQTAANANNVSRGEEVRSGRAGARSHPQGRSEA